MDTLSKPKNNIKRCLVIWFSAIFWPSKRPNFGSDLQPVLTTDLKLNIKELSESYWRVRGVKSQKNLLPVLK